MHLLIVQYAGDYREAVHRFERQELETYYAQKYTVDSVAALTQLAEQVTVVCLLTQTIYNEVLSNGVRAIGLGLQEPLEIEKILACLTQCQPSHLIVRTPIRQIFNWAIEHQVPTLALLADSFQTKGWRNQAKNFLLSKALNHDSIKWISNHGINACLSLQTIGVRADKIIPWDYPSQTTPAAFTPKHLAPSADRELFYVGTVSEAKGVGDLIQALAHLKPAGANFRLKIAGGGELTPLQVQAQQLGVAAQIEFLGTVPNCNIIGLMRSADVIVVPSRHSYPEGFPLTIYEALCSRTPLIASDHPMFARHLQHRSSALIFPAGDPIALAEAIQSLLSEPELYSRLSEVSLATWQQLQIPVKWADLIFHWLSPSAEADHWLMQHRLSSGLYQVA